jgi:hypothetical protein
MNVMPRFLSILGSGCHVFVTLKVGFLPLVQFLAGKFKGSLTNPDIRNS